jgi:hypothetical protein
MTEIVLGVLVLLSGITWRALGDSAHLPVQLWQAITYAGVAVLGVGLIRDLSIVIRRFRKKSGPPRCACDKMICLESTVGSLLVASGLGILLLGVQHEMLVRHASLAIAAGVVLIASGYGKDVVVIFRREKDHQNVIPW